MSGEIGKQITEGNTFYLSAITHFEIVWGYSVMGIPPIRYKDFLRAIGAEIIPLTSSDAEGAAEFKPSRTDLLDALIAASVKRYGAIVWTADRDFLKFLPRNIVRVF